jgi:hypothetical protein
VVCATGYEYNFPFLKHNSFSDRHGTSCRDDDNLGASLSWDRYVVEPL